jgi:hypothetical protein
MQLTIDPSKLSGLTAIVSRLNSVEGAEQTTPEAYLLARCHEILDSYTQQELDRVKAEAALGPKFDLRRFHDAVLGQGAVPLDVLESAITRWIAAEQAR